MGGGGTPKTKTDQQPTMPSWLESLLRLGGQQTYAGLQKAPITEFQNPNIENIVGPDPATLDALKYFQSIVGGGATPGIMESFNKLQLPLLQQQAMQAGLGRSGALLDAEAIGQGSQIMNALQLQSGAAGAEAGIGDYLRQVAQQQASAPYQDYLRRQGISEELLQGAMGMMPSTVGQQGTQTKSKSGLWSWLIGESSSPMGK